MKILFVCLGNICRSPMAEAIFQHKTSYTSWNADSAGTGSYHIGSRPDARTLDVLQESGIMSNHRAQQLHLDHFELFDYLVAMDRNNLSHMMAMAGPHEKKVLLMGDFDPARPGADVPDPYYGDHSDFVEVFEMLDRSIDAFIKALQSQ